MEAWPKLVYTTKRASRYSEVILLERQFDPKSGFSRYYSAGITFSGGKYENYELKAKAEQMGAVEKNFPYKMPAPDLSEILTESEEVKVFLETHLIEIDYNSASQIILALTKKESNKKKIILIDKIPKSNLVACKENLYYQLELKNNYSLGYALNLLEIKVGMVIESTEYSWTACENETTV